MAQGSEHIQDEAVEDEASGRPGLLSTGIVGLDEVLDGGMTRGDLYLIAGPPGSGKTTLGNQIVYAQASQGAIALYATVLAETHERMLMHLAGFDFFAPEQVANRVHYVSLYDELSTDGLPGALTLLRRLVREHRATLLVVDGASLFDDFAPSPVEFRRFTSELHAQLSALGCTTIFLADDDGVGAATIGFQVDGVITLEDNSIGMRDVRLLRVTKQRGANPLRGRHHVTIGRGGLEVFPRLEAAVLRRKRPATDATTPGTQRFGVPRLDEMLGGGLPAASTTLLLGVPGTGKTCLGLSFVVEGAHVGEPGLIASLDERPPQLLTKAAGLGLDLGAQIDAGRARIIWSLPLDLSLDAWARELLAAVEETGARRVFIDPAGAFHEMEMYAERLSSFLTALVGDLRQRDVGAVFAAELRSVVGHQFEMPPASFPVLVDNAVVLRFAEIDSRLKRVVSVLKVSGAAHDTSLRELTIGPSGVAVADAFEQTEGLLTGAPRSVALKGTRGVPPLGEAG